MRQHPRPVRVGRTRITDPLFGSYFKLVAERVLPYQWEVLNDWISGEEPHYCIENFRIAAGDHLGRHHGPVFQDTDLYKWLEAAAFCIESGFGEKLIPIADDAVELIQRAQQPDGYLNTYVTIECPETRWSNLAEGHELYSGGHLIEAGVAYYQATGKDALLNVGARFADLVESVFGAEEGKCHGYPGHQEIELALVKLYHVTGKKKYLSLARYFIDQRGSRPNYLLAEMAQRGGRNVFPEFAEYDEEYAQSHMPPVRQAKAVGHAVRATYMYSAMADLAMEYGDDALAQSCKDLFENITKRRMYITGGIGSSGKLERFTADYDLPNDRMYCESCASVGLMMFGQRMMLLTGEASYYDAVERALCNTVLAGISKDADRYFYVNPLEVWPDNCLPSTAMSHVRPVRQKWFSTACCPPNIARTLASLGQYIYAESDTELYVNLLISSEVETAVGGVTVRLTMESDYMRSGTVRLSVRSGGETGAFLHIRLPGYIKNPKLLVNGRETEITVRSGYVVLPLEREMDVELRGETAARFVAANRNVRADLGKLAIMKGPFVYCLEETDNGENLPAISIRADTALEEAPPEPGLPGTLPTVTLMGRRLTRTVDDENELYAEPSFVQETVGLKAVPYALWCNRTPGEMLVWLRAEL